MAADSGGVEPERSADDDWAMALCDARGRFPEPVERVLPGGGRTGDWPLHVHCFLLRLDGGIILVDTGVGPPGAPAAGWFAEPGNLIAELTATGVTPSDVTHVILTHLHIDHVGWTVDRGAGKPTFPNARYVVQQTELRHLGERAPYLDHVKPLADAGLLDAVDGTVRILPRLGVEPTPGHTPGHQSVVADLGDRTLFMSGDVFVHPAQLERPDVGYRYEHDQQVAAATRRDVLGRVARPGVLLAPAHFAATMVLVEATSTGSSHVTVASRCRHADGTDGAP